MRTRLWSWTLLGLIGCGRPAATHLRPSPDPADPRSAETRIGPMSATLRTAAVPWEAEETQTEPPKPPDDAEGAAVPKPTVHEAPVMATYMGMPLPTNVVPMMAGEGPHGPIGMGGMFTVVKVRDKVRNYDEDPGWYENPEGTRAHPVDLSKQKVSPPSGSAFTLDVPSSHAGLVPHGTSGPSPARRMTIPGASPCP